VIGLDYLVSTIARLSARVDLTPSFQWATVTATNPLQIRLDGMTEPLAGSVDALVMPPVGRRVMVMVWNRRAIIMGALRGPDLPEIPKMPDEIVSTDWRPLTVSSGWGTVLGHTPRYRRWGDLVIISGAVERRVGGYLSSLTTMPDAACRPAGTQFIGSSVTSRGQASELYMSGSGVVGVQGYTAIGDDPGMIVPLACIYTPIKK